MSFRIYLVFLSLCIGCTSERSEKSEYKEDNNKEEILIVTDSIHITSLRLNDFWQHSDNIIVKLSNPYSDTIFLENRYSIYDESSHTPILNGRLPKITITPHSSYTFTVSLGMDSIWYHKKRTYLFSFHGATRYRDVLFFERLSNLGYFNKLNGEWVLNPDSMSFPVEVVKE